MPELHIEEFCRDAAAILLTLYHRFPRPGLLFVEDISGPDEPDEYGVHSKRHLACLGAMLWLADEGYLRYGGLLRQEGVEEAVLSSKGLILLALPAPGSDGPDSKGPQEALSPNEAVRMEGLLREGHSGALAKRILALIADRAQSS